MNPQAHSQGPGMLAPMLNSPATPSQKLSKALDPSTREALAAVVAEAKGRGWDQNALTAYFASMGIDLAVYVAARDGQEVANAIASNLAAVSIHGLPDRPADASNDVSVIPTPDRAALMEFAAHLFGDLAPSVSGLVECAWTAPYAPHGLNAACMFDPGDLDGLADLLEAKNGIASTNVYISGALRRGDADKGRRGSASDVVSLVALWADFDHAGAAEAAIASLRSINLIPTFAVLTGDQPHSRAQFWWKLEEPLTDLVQGKALLARIAEALNGDRAVADIARVMRAAGSIAWPLKAGRTLEGTKILRDSMSPRAPYSVAEIERALDALKPSQKTSLKAALGVSGTGDRQSQGDRIKASREPGKWHANARAWVAHMASGGATLETIIATAASFQLEGHTLDETEREFRAMAEGAIRKFSPQAREGAPKSRSWDDADGWLSASQLEARAFPPVVFVVEGILPQGLTILAGRPKLGKSWAALDIALAVARGGYVLSGESPCEAGEVLYLALEDTPRRLQSRLRILAPKGGWPEALTFRTDCPVGDDGQAMVRAWLQRATKPRLVVVDTLAKVRPPGRPNDYAGDYSDIADLKALADEFEVAFLVIHHVRKGGAEDPIESVSGTFGLTGSADTILVLNRDAQGVSLVGRGRDLEEFAKAIQFDKETCRWRVLGDVGEIRRSDERSLVLDALGSQTEPMSPSEIADITGQPSGAIRQMLVRMARAGEIMKQGRGRYSLTPCHNGHNGHNVTNALDGGPTSNSNCDDVTVVTPT